MGYTYSDNINNSFWDIETSGMTDGVGNQDPDPADVIGKTTAEMQTRSTFTNAGWDFTTPIWTIDDGVDYPRLWWENSKPLADAGQDQTGFAWIDGFAEVTLDGSGSSDPDGDELTYSWTWTIDANSITATGVSPTIYLPVEGQPHTIELIVNDGTVDSEPNEVVITVVAALEVGMKFTPQALNFKSQGKWLKAHLVLGEGYTLADVDVDSPAYLEPLGVESDHIKAFVNEDSLVKLVIAFARADICGAGDFGTGQVTVVGQLSDGRYYYGTDTIKLIHNDLEALALIASYWLAEDCRKPHWCDGADMNQDGVVNIVDFALFDSCCIEVIK